MLGLLLFPCLTNFVCVCGVGWVGFWGGGVKILSKPQNLWPVARNFLNPISCICDLKMYLLELIEFLIMCISMFTLVMVYVKNMFLNSSEVALDPIN